MVIRAYSNARLKAHPAWHIPPAPGCQNEARKRPEMPVQENRTNPETAQTSPDEQPMPSFQADIQAAGALLRNAIAETEGPMPPSWVVEFMLRSWRRYLVLVHHDCGSDGRAWLHAVDLTHRLLASIAPIESPAERSRLVSGLPRLVTDIRCAIDSAQIEGDERDRFLEQLRQLHFSLFKPEQMEAAERQVDLSQTIAMDVRDPRFRGLLDKLDGADSVEHIDM